MSVSSNLPQVNQKENRKYFISHTSEVNSFNTRHWQAPQHCGGHRCPGRAAGHGGRQTLTTVLSRSSPRTTACIQFFKELLLSKFLPYWKLQNWLYWHIEETAKNLCFCCYSTSLSYCPWEAVRMWVLFPLQVYYQLYK